jgi:hypothetical protein
MEREFFLFWWCLRLISEICFVKKYIQIIFKRDRQKKNIQVVIKMLFYARCWAGMNAELERRKNCSER